MFKIFTLLAMAKWLLRRERHEWREAYPGGGCLESPFGLVRHGRLSKRQRKVPFSLQMAFLYANSYPSPRLTSYGYHKVEFTGLDDVLGVQHAYLLYLFAIAVIDNSMEGSSLLLLNCPRHSFFEIVQILGLPGSDLYECKCHFEDLQRLTSSTCSLRLATSVCHPTA